MRLLPGDQVVQAFALFGPQGIAGPGIAQSDDEAGFPLEIQQLAEFFAVKPAQDAGGET